MTDLKLGKLPARPNAIKFKLSTYVDLSALPPIPKDFGHEEGWSPVGILGNSQYGDCVVAGGAEEHSLWAHMAGKTLSFNTADVLRDFTAITGLPPSPLTGADMQQAAAYRQRVGLLGADGQRHKIAAYLEIRRGNLAELYAAMFLFGAVGVGVAIHSAQFDQYNRHKAWAIAGGSFEGYHYVPCVSLRSNVVVVTWGRFQAVRPSFLVSECDEAVAYVSYEALTNNKSPEGFDAAALITDLSYIPNL